jgi:hypothetical protein
MGCEETVELTNRDFRRLTGAKRAAFAKMAEILSVSEAEKRCKGGQVCFSRLSLFCLSKLFKQGLRFA